jgi:DNA polymerase III delta subunit
MRLHRLILQGEAPLKILFMMARELRLIYQMGFLFEEGKTPQEIMTSLGITSKKRFSKLRVGARFFRGVDLGKNLKDLLETDRVLKSYERRYHPLILELLVMKLAGFSRGAR